MLPYASFAHCAYVSIRQHTSCIRSSSDVAIRQFHPLRLVSPTAHTSAYVMHTSCIRHAYGAPAVLPYASFTICVYFLSLILTYAYSRTLCVYVCACVRVTLSHTCTISAAIDGGDSRPIRMAEFLPAHTHTHSYISYLPI
jgi:hypothetical protein